MSSILNRIRSKSSEPSGDTNASPHESITDEKKVGKSNDVDIQEAEANQRLRLFEKAHRWDPNLEDKQLEEIDDAVNTRDPNAEGILYDEVFENSPYPEVSM